MADVSTTMRFALLLTLANAMIDPYTLLIRGGVFANVQTGNVVLLGLNLSQRHWGDALEHVWSLLAFITGLLLAAHLKSGRLDRFVRYPLRWVMAIHVTVLVVIGFVPESVPHDYVIVPISLMAGTQVGLFRFIGDINYFPVATTGNLVRFVMSGYDAIVERDEGRRRAFTIYSMLIPTFALGAVIGAIATRAMGVHAIWLSAVLLAVALVLLISDRREGTQI